MSELPLSTSDVKQEVKLRMGEEGVSAVPAQTVVEWWDEVVQKHGDKPALFQKKPQEGEDVEETPWTSWTWKEYKAKVDAFAKALISLGLDRFDVINIIGFNAPEWFFAHFGTILAGGASAGIYATNGPDACKYVSQHSKAKVVVVDGMKQLEKYFEISSDLPHLKAIVVYGGPNEFRKNLVYKVSVPVYTFAQFLELGTGKGDDDKATDETLKKRGQDCRPGHTCSLIYTSGTTGPPKAVMITHDNITWVTRAAELASRRGYFDSDDVAVSYLPLSHIAAQMLDMFLPLHTGASIYFAQPDALKGSLGKTLKEVRPTFFFGVPRVWEKIYDKLQEVGKSTTGVKKVLSTWAKSQASAYWETCDYDALKSFSLTRTAPVQYLMAQLLLHQAHVALGMDRCREFYVAAAPTEMKIFLYFASIDIPIMELFGQSECTGPHTVNTYSAFKFGTVGRPLKGTETKIDEDTGELCYRGRHIFAGYMGMPDATKGTIDDEGWLHSGDIATVDENHDPDIPQPSGFVSITGRIKELIITAGGENVPPVLIEDQLKLAMPALSNAMVIGDKRKFLSVLLSLRVQVDEDGSPTNKLAGLALDTSKEIGSAATTTDEARLDPKWHSYFDEGVKKANATAASRAQNVGKWSLLPNDFSETGGELTPTLKLKRKVAAEKYADIIEGMYS